MLLVLRHAKAARHGTGDHERPLTGRGRRDATAAGALLAGYGPLDLVLCSPALRTRQTWERAAAGGATAAEVRHLDQIYAARVTDLVRVVRSLPDRARTVLLVGHSPGVADLVTLLAAPAPTTPAWARLESGYRTCGLAVLGLSGGWAAAGGQRARLHDFSVPRG